MNVLVYPGKPCGTINIPASKSQSHRAIIAASLASGKSVLSNMTYSEDINQTIGAMEKIGTRFIRSADRLIVYGAGRISVPDDNFFECNESGSTLRFLIPLLSLGKQKVVFVGKKSLMSRPLGIYEKIFGGPGYSFVKKPDSVIVSGRLKPGIYEIHGNVSSQFVSGLLFALPLLEGDSEIHVLEPFESRRYVDMTIDVLKKAGIVVRQDGNCYFIEGNQAYKRFDLIIEGDFSQMAFFAVMGLLSGDVECKNMPEKSLQPDHAILDFIHKAGGNYIYSGNSFRFLASSLNGFSCDIGQSPDLAPVLAVMAAFSEGKSVIGNASRLKIKESDRLAAICQIINGLGGYAVSDDSSIEIIGCSFLIGGASDSFNDHRIVMALAAAAVKCQNPVLIRNAEAVNKSYPRFFRDLASLGIKTDITEE
ncbi:MAG TPA: 3-phosphoshikimate 1-carboxyvinyltransferase [Candidatus Izemoplasmatales bacterium]|nr:3-phosphoshikimate 1-carboxyvinyltransferase [Candidatus Izemoplasmatales bacterium]